MLLSPIVALAAFFGSLGIASKYLDSVADRIAPDLRSGTKPYRPVKVMSKAFLWRLAEGIAVALLLALWIRGSIALRYALAAVATIGFLIQTYVLRLRPIFARGATQKERAILFALSVTGAFSLGYLLLW
jgi:small-conductance mechanosensitive channel